MKASWTDSSQTLSTQETTSSPAQSPYTQEQIDKTVAFFARIVTVYGRGRAKTLWGGSDKQLQLMRREWAPAIGQLTVDEVELIFDRLKWRLAKGDEDYQWPDITKMMLLIAKKKTVAAHEVFQPGLPEPEWRKEQRRELGRLAAKTCKAVLSGSACFLEDKPNED